MGYASREIEQKSQALGEWLSRYCTEREELQALCEAYGVPAKGTPRQLKQRLLSKWSNMTELEARDIEALVQAILAERGKVAWASNKEQQSLKRAETSKAPKATRAPAGSAAGPPHPEAQTITLDPLAGSSGLISRRQAKNSRTAAGELPAAEVGEGESARRGGAPASKSFHSGKTVAIRSRWSEPCLSPRATEQDLSGEDADAGSANDPRFTTSQAPSMRQRTRCGTSSSRPTQQRCFSEPAIPTQPKEGVDDREARVRDDISYDERIDPITNEDIYGRHWVHWANVPILVKQGFMFGLKTGVLDPISGNQRNKHYVQGICDWNEGLGSSTQDSNVEDQDTQDPTHPDSPRNAEEEATQEETSGAGSIDDVATHFKTYLEGLSIEVSDDELQGLRRWLQGVYCHQRATTSREVADAVPGPSSTPNTCSARLPKRRRLQDSCQEEEVEEEGLEFRAAERPNRNPKRKCRFSKRYPA